ncbi:hypothetical protein D3C71_1724270 [compost metagenome]
MSTGQCGEVGGLLHVALGPVQIAHFHQAQDDHQAQQQQHHHHGHATALARGRAVQEGKALAVAGLQGQAFHGGPQRLLPPCLELGSVASKYSGIEWSKLLR